nr:T9SS type A sorting domain-containing protein [Bacteroidota bacterium]
MKKLTFISAIFLLLIVNVKTQPIQINGEILADTNKILVLKVWGTSYERGYAYGYLTGNKIENVIEGFLIPAFGSFYQSARELVTNSEVFEIDTIFQNEAKAIVNGMALAGIDTTMIDYVDLLVLNCFFDLEGFSDEVEGFGCSTFLNWGSATENTDLDGKSVISRHYDYPDYVPALANNAVLVIHFPSEENTQPWLLGDAAGWFTPSGIGVNQQGISVFQNTMSDCYCSPSSNAVYEPFLFTLRRALESADYNGDGVNNTQDVKDALSSNPQGYAGGYIISTLARYDDQSDSLTATIAEIAPEEPFITFRTNTYDDAIPGDNLYAANAQIKRNNANNYCSRYLNMVNHMGDGTGIGSEENWNLMKNYSGVTYNYLFTQFIPDWNILKASVYRDNSNAWQLEPTTFSTRELFNQPPIFSSSPDTTGLMNIEYTYNIYVNDPDPNDTITITAEEIPYWLNFTNYGNGSALLQGIPDQEGIYQISLNAFDGLVEIFQEFEIIVDDQSSCLPEGITFTSQEEIDNFQTNHPGCTEIEGDVSISGFSFFYSNITNLDGLDVITSIGGTLSIWKNGLLTDLGGLENLTTIGNNLNIGKEQPGGVGGNLVFATLNGLENLSHIGGWLIIYNNPALTNISSLNNLTFLGGDMVVAETALTSLSGLENLNVIYGGLTIGDSQGNLTSLAGLDNITSIEGDLLISNCAGLIDLSALSNLQNLGGNFKLYENENLESLSGLENLTLIEGNIDIQYCNSLTNLNGLNNIESINGSIGVYIRDNDALLSLVGLESLETITGSLRIGSWASGNNSLFNLVGLENLTLVGGDMEIGGNNSLVNCSGLNNLSEIGGRLLISHNDNLVNLEGLGSLISVGDDCSVSNNPSLTNFTGLNNLTTIEGILVINSNNALTNFNGLDSLRTVGLLSMEFNDVLTSLEGLENLDSIWGDLLIRDNKALINLQGLENLDYIGGTLRLDHNNNLITLEGIESLTSVAGDVNIGDWSGGNIALTCLSGLNSLETIGGEMNIERNDVLLNLSGLESLNSIGGDLTISFNDVLENLSGLNSLNSINGTLEISFNYALESLSGLNNVSPGSIENLYVYYNSALSNCAVESICEYLADTTGTVSIHSNAEGCDSMGEVQEVCLYLQVSEEDNMIPFDMTISPSPVNDFATLSFDIELPGLVLIEIYNATGVRIRNWHISVNSAGQNNFVVDFSGLPVGMYCCRAQLGSDVVTLKIIKSK